MPRKYIPKRGDIIDLNFNPQAGREQAKRRPALVLSPIEYNRISRLCIVAPITSGVGLSGTNNFRVKIDATDGIEGVVISDQVKSLDWGERQAQFKCKAPEALLDKVIGKYCTLLR